MGGKKATPTLYISHPIPSHPMLHPSNLPLSPSSPGESNTPTQMQKEEKKKKFAFFFINPRPCPYLFHPSIHPSRKKRRLERRWEKKKKKERRTGNHVENLTPSQKPRT
jgi:hypothetical protein